MIKCDICLEEKFYHRLVTLECRATGNKVTKEICTDCLNRLGLRK